MAPEMKEAPGERRKHTAEDTSSGFPSRLVGRCCVAWRIFDVNLITKVNCSMIMKDLVNQFFFYELIVLQLFLTFATSEKISSE